MYLVLFIIGVVLNISLIIREKNIDIKEIILGIIIFSTVSLIITFGIIYLIYYLFNQELFIDTINENFELYKNMPLEFYF